MRYLRIPILVAVAMFVGVWPAAADVDINQTFPSALTIPNPCNNDIVVLTGQNHLLVHSTAATSGNVEFFVDLSSNYAGFGTPSGVNYQGDQDAFTAVSAQNPLPIVFTISNDILLESATGQDNFKLRITFHITIAANGVPTASIDNFSTTCGG